MGVKSRRAKRREKELRHRQNSYEAQLEYEQNKPRFGLLEPRNAKQKRLIQQLKEKRLNFVIGPAGVGKSFVPTSYAVEQLTDGLVDKIIITRPMVGCDEDMGFLPGDEADKFGGWIEPFMDVMTGKLGGKHVKTLMKYGKIVARPLMMMRGITFRNSIVILDEAQNTTPGQMKMFLTRLGEGTRMVINGDLEQSDLPFHRGNGLADSLQRFEGSVNIGITAFTEDEITRDPLVRDIILAYRQPTKMSLVS